MKILVALGTFVLGLVVGVGSVALHRFWWGLLLAIAATATTAYALPPGWARISFAIGWVAIVGCLAVPLDKGGYVIEGDVRGYSLLGFAVALAVAAMVSLPPLRRGDPKTDHSPT